MHEAWSTHNWISPMPTLVQTASETTCSSGRHARWIKRGENQSIENISDLGLVNIGRNVWSDQLQHHLSQSVISFKALPPHWCSRCYPAWIEALQEASQSIGPYTSACSSRALNRVFQPVSRSLPASDWQSTVNSWECSCAYGEKEEIISAQSEPEIKEKICEKHCNFPIRRYKILQDDGSVHATRSSHKTGRWQATVKASTSDPPSSQGAP